MPSKKKRESAGLDWRRGQILIKDMGEGEGVA